MEKNKRSGKERREHMTSPSAERRKKGERRTVVSDADETIQMFKKVPMFKSLTSEQLKIILCICSKKKYPGQEYIYRIGEESDNMFILLKGEISIMFSSGVELQKITPAGTVGEMGIFTGESRSATVMTVSECTVLSFNKVELFRLFIDDTNLAIKILLNVIKDLSQKMRKDNQQLGELLYRIRSIDLI